MDSPTPQHTGILAELWDSQQQDLTLHLKDGIVHVPKKFFAGMSPAFRAMLDAGMLETKENMVHMEQVTTDIWTLIEEFLLSSKSSVSVENVGDVLEASNMYQIDRMVDHCVEFLLSMCTPENCIAVRRLSLIFGFDALVKKATKVLTDNLSALWKSDDFLCLEKSELLDLLEEELVITEDDLCGALLAWMQNKEASVGTCAELFWHLRLKDISDDCFERCVLNNTKMLRHQDIRRWVQGEKLRRAKMCPPLGPTRDLQKRRPFNVKDTLVVLGDNARREACIYVWSAYENKWTSRAVPWNSDRCFSSAIVGEEVVVTGGMNSKRMHVFDLETLSWSQGPNLLQDRGHHGMAAVGDEVYVVGGSDRHTVSLVSVEGYSQTRGRWVHVGNLLFSSLHCSAAALGDRILVAGREGFSQDIQTFCVKTKTPAVFHLGLRDTVSRLISNTTDTSVFILGSSGKLWRVEERDGKVCTTSRVHLENWCYGLCGVVTHVPSNYLRLVSDTCVRSTTACWSLQGEMVENEDVGTLPDVEHVYQAHALRVSQSIP